MLAAMPRKRTFLTFVGNDTLPLYLSHTYFLVLCDLFFAAVELPHAAAYGVVLALSLVLVTGLSTPLYRRFFHGLYGFLTERIYPTKGSAE